MSFNVCLFGIDRESSIHTWWASMVLMHERAGVRACVCICIGGKYFAERKDTEKKSIQTEWNGIEIGHSLQSNKLKFISNFNCTWPSVQQIQKLVSRFLFVLLSCLLCTIWKGKIAIKKVHASWINKLFVCTQQQQPQTMGILSVRSFFCCDLMTGGISIGLIYMCIGFFFLFCGPDSLTIPENIVTARKCLYQSLTCCLVFLLAICSIDTM